MENLVKTWPRRNRKGKCVYYRRWIGEDGREKYQSLGHSEKRDAERQRREKGLALASSVALGEDFGAHFVRTTQSREIGKEEDTSKNSQPRVTNEVSQTCGDIT